MKRSIISSLVVVIAVHVFPVVHCRAETHATFGLYADDLHTTQCVYADRLTPFLLYFYMFVSPDGDGVEALEMNVELSSSNIMTSGDQVDFDDIVSGTTGSMPGEIAISFGECCETGWFRVFRMQAEVFDRLFPSYIAIGPVEHMHPPYPTVTDCTTNHEQWDVPVCYSAFINTPGCDLVISTKESTWGAVKSMYK